MFERFTDKARRVVVLAQEDARALNHNYIGTEHILLGLLHEGEGVGAKALEVLGISIDRARNEVLEVIGRGPPTPPASIPFTPRAQKVLEFSLREALQLGHNYIGTEHILLGLIREGEGVAAQVLVKMGAELSVVRAQVIQLLSGHGGGQPAAGPTVGFATSDATAARLVLSSGPHGVTCGFCGRDVWELDRYVAGQGVLICDACVAAARRVITSATDTEGRGLAMPPRVFGQPPDSTAVDRVQQTLRRVFGGSDQEDVRDLIEDGPRLASVRAEVRRRFPQVIEPSISLDRVRFRGTNEAEVRFTISLGGGGGGPTIDGEMARTDDRWRVTRRTFCQVMQLAGIPCPPPEEPEV